MIQAKNPAFIESCELIVQVHELMVAGRGDSAEANALRERSEAPWYELNDDEEDWVRFLSADLYLVGQEMFAAPSRHAKPPPPQTVEQAVVYLARLSEEAEWLAPEDAMALRGDCWEQLCVPSAAKVFHAEAARVKGAPHPIRGRSRAEAASFGRASLPSHVAPAFESRWAA